MAIKSPYYNQFSLSSTSGALHWLDRWSLQMPGAAQPSYWTQELLYKIQALGVQLSTDIARYALYAVDLSIHLGLVFWDQMFPNLSIFGTGAYESGKLLQKQIDELKASKDPFWRDKALGLIQASQRRSPRGELERLRGANILTPHAEQRLDKGIKNSVLFQPSFSSIYAKVIYAQALEIKSLYQDDYYVFLHAQAAPWPIVSYLVMQLWQDKNPELDFSHFAPLRAPCATGKPGRVESLCQRLSFQRGINKYRDRWFQLLTLCDDDPKVRDDLLSVDGLMFNYQPFESSLFFLTTNSNIMFNPKTVRNVLFQTILHFYPDAQKDYAMNLAEMALSSIQWCFSPTGNLFVICTPKEKTESLAYRAHPFGRVCICHPFSDDRKILDKHQKGTLDESAKCSSLLSCVTPQYRLYLPDITPDSGVHTFFLSSLNPVDQTFIKSSVYRISQEILKYKPSFSSNVSKV
ncbi:MAG TPA: hypothetical protein VLE96_04800 [Chlamydiales bacterium]|nr:hypothetical protein [Chlamydiales bacterium]